MHDDDHDDDDYDDDNKNNNNNKSFRVVDRADIWVVVKYQSVADVRRCVTEY